MTTQPETAPPTDMEVDLPGGDKIKLPNDVAKRVIQARDALKNEVRQHAERAGALEAEKAAAAARATRAEEQALMEAAAKKGEIDQVRAIAERSGRERLDRVSNRMVDVALSGEIAKIDGVVRDASAQADLRALLRGSCRYDVETDTLTVVDAAGKPQLGSDGRPLSVDTFIRQAVDSRPHFKSAAAAPGSGAVGAGKIPGQKVMRRADYEAMPSREGARFLQSGGLLID